MPHRKLRFCGGPKHWRAGELIQLTRRGAVFTGSAAGLRDLCAQYRLNHYIILPNLLAPDLLETILGQIEAAPFVKRENDGITTQSIIDDLGVLNLLLFLVNVPGFQRFVEYLTGCRRIANFRGRVYRLYPRTDDRIVWHTDACDHRMVALSLNLTTKEYRGGTLQIRYHDSKEIRHEVRNTRLGDALLMRVSKKLCHRVLPVEGEVPRTALAGWFRWEKDKDESFHAALRKAAESIPGIQEASEADSNQISGRRP